MLTLRQLEYLVTIADTGSFALAARVANVSQPTLSQQVRTLEERLGAKLLERSATGAILTPVGRSIVATARRMLSDASDIVALAAGSTDSLTGTLKLGTTPTLGPYLLSPIIAELHRMAPRLRLHVREGIPDEQVRELSRGDIDVLLGPLPMTGEDLTVEPLFREPLHLVAALDHPIDAAIEADREVLTGSPLLTLDPRHHLARQAAEVADHYGMTIAPDYYGTSLESLHQMVASGLGLTLLPSLYLRSEVGGATGLKILPVQGWRAHRSIAIAWRRQSPMSAAFKLIADHVQGCARTLLAG
ncbi:hydrogen peroxide-inducible genes activator [Sphingomonas yabuuchiae]|uniref:Hydrogen peroxide-inducible genes activator n=1 Tax=Sphingomonas yabuuchiae TaxID=172044 RepID=A0AA40ZY64_9SPHN|nr:hydrogen peroxide-inducible genes activator [Sphingomonas yabuuchiae]MBB4609277.1 LysR family hydrogen peroxide-inducible transcriptional activator [Sphingomonas yabuuchiae]MBN3558588.1 hydrogen peroxide-inducible genes activator [Sphingomonas yabuuchiae]